MFSVHSVASPTNYTGTMTRVYLFDVYGLALRRAGLNGYGRLDGGRPHKDYSELLNLWAHARPELLDERIKTGNYQWRRLW